MVFIPENWQISVFAVLFFSCRPPTSRALEKAPSLDCDGVIFDLEDAVLRN